ncbi:hypothetical protein CU102_12500 [Phyllobacterium brassicacearum]|uniref:NusG-like N-terminal domain-containing protein n=1 Tax=Phyllobacterium brassicacearum TaxID=314235 RepID=A0A2P7BQ18_9HYPH|nr:transcription termination/antitermination NusG family protein [Phyllobacterium brassicacearum]PSH68578.1 hypothetical protein CU102_12500 [Phyllobacterium brassicacearum]TDQ24124.1 transcription termination factor nusG [Phyllobacterium brassicacearum]
MKAVIDKDRHWYVVRTNVKAEVKASENVRKAGYDVYYPRRRMEVKNKRTHTYTTRESALMPRYLFVGLSQADMNFFKVRACDGVECILGVDGRPAQICADHVEAIFLAEIDMEFDDTRAARIYRKEEVASAKEHTAKRFPVGKDLECRVGTRCRAYSTVQGGNDQDIYLEVPSFSYFCRKSNLPGFRDQN